MALLALSRFMQVPHRSSRGDARRKPHGLCTTRRVWPSLPRAVLREFRSERAVRRPRASQRKDLTFNFDITISHFPGVSSGMTFCVPD
jgi:hypothetical protein